MIAAVSVVSCDGRQMHQSPENAGAGNHPHSLPERADGGTQRGERDPVPPHP